jgi:crotonobetainyl-CoA:carnitine CoA-transferase CaiB-like acyl-CoA transferase
MTSASRVGPLTHVRVLDLSRMYPGAFATSLLADLGADVRKVEAPGFGDGMRFLTGGGFEAAHVALNRGKRSLTLDLRHERAPEVLRRLVREADVVVDSHRPGALDASGIGYAAMSAENPRVVWCSITGFGQDGPFAQAPGHDITYLGAAGLLSRLAASGVEPTPPQVSLSLPMGGLMAVVGILSALAQRDRTGHGAYVDASLVDSAMWALVEPIARAASAPGPDWGDLAARQVYRCADGRYVTVAATEPKSWAALCAALELPDLAEHRHGVDEPATIARLAEAFASRPQAAWVESPGFAGGVGPLYTPDDLSESPQVVARGSITTIDGTDTKVLGNPLRIRGADGDATTATTPAPDLGADTAAVLAEAGFTEAEITELRAAGVLGNSG